MYLSITAGKAREIQLNSYSESAKVPIELFDEISFKIKDASHNGFNRVNIDLKNKSQYYEPIVLELAANGFQSEFAPVYSILVIKW